MRMTKTLPQNSEKNVMYVSVVINSFFLGIDLVCHLIFAKFYVRGSLRVTLISRFFCITKFVKLTCRENFT